MNTKTMAVLVSKIAVLTILLFALYSFNFLDMSLGKNVQTAPALLLLVAFLHASVLSYPIVRSRWSGWRLVGAIFLLFYGVMYIMTAIEAVYLPQVLPPDLVLSLLVNGAITAGVFSFFAVWIHGHMRGNGGQQEINHVLVMPWTQWIWKFVLSALAYVVLYILFGALVFLPLATVLDPKTLAEASALSLPSWIIPFQAVRGLMWVAIALPVIRMMRGSWWEAALAVALSFAVIMGANQMMALDVSVGFRAAHTAELFGENFDLGWIIVWLFHRQHGFRRHVFQWAKAN